MPNGRKKTARKGQRKAAPKPRASRPRPEPRQDAAEQSAEYVAGLIRRGEAAYPMEDGRLPPGATHEIVDDAPGKPPTVVRRRFSLT
ncbi:MAG TPA: hypothetical protein VH854_05835 [Thermoanaerobaculia bacterium]|nr:hypothetical protein [Thermoanaerobaculia bacterium]